LICAKLDLREELDRHGAEKLLLWLDLRNGSSAASCNLVLFTRPRRLELPDPGLTFTVEEADNNSFCVTITGRKPALWVWLELPGDSLHCSDNFLHLEPGTPVKILVRPSTLMSVSELAVAVRVRSLFDTY
jgi:hypothetical protein